MLWPPLLLFLPLPLLLPLRLAAPAPDGSTARGQVGGGRQAVPCVSPEASYVAVRHRPKPCVGV